MSFKRDGNDISLLNRLKNDRVSELLGTHIPEDEAKLLSNGRLTCLVCTHRPIFDTINMLARHRQGKKHLYELNKYIKRNELLEVQKIKKEQLDAVEAAKLAELANAQTLTKLLGPKSNLSCCTQHGDINAGSRRQVIELPDIRNNQTNKISPDMKSCSSQLRKYLKQMKRKQPLEKVVEKGRSSYLTNETDTNKVQRLTTSTSENTTPIITKKSVSLAKNDSADLSRNLSGWILDKKTGNWIKDPEAEFDTDEE